MKYLVLTLIIFISSCKKDSVETINNNNTPIDNTQASACFSFMAPTYGSVELKINGVVKDTLSISGHMPECGTEWSYTFTDSAGRYSYSARTLQSSTFHSWSDSFDIEKGKCHKILF